LQCRASSSAYDRLCIAILVVWSCAATCWSCGCCAATLLPVGYSTDSFGQSCVPSSGKPSYQSWVGVVCCFVGSRCGGVKGPTVNPLQLGNTAVGVEPKWQPDGGGVAERRVAHAAPTSRRGVGWVRVAPPRADKYGGRLLWANYLQPPKDLRVERPRACGCE
jgi:hypothetical protein